MYISVSALDMKPKAETTVPEDVWRKGRRLELSLIQQEHRTRGIALTLLLHETLLKSEVTSVEFHIVIF